MDNRRSVNRWQINFQAKIRFEGAESFTKCLINDITLKGIRITLHQRLPEDSFLKFTLSCDQECVLENVEAWVVWHKSNVIDDSYSYGLYFTRIHDGDKEKIYRFVRCCFPALLNAQWWQISQEEAAEQLKNTDFVSQLKSKEEGGEAMDDQRIFERFRVDFPMRYFDSRVNKEVRARALDISAKGLGITSDEQLDPHAPLEVWLEIPDQGEPLYTRGTVVWSKPQGTGGYKAGINLDKADLMGLSRVLRTI